MKVNNDLIGSNLTRTMLERGDKQIWCAIDNDSDKQAMTEYEGYRFTAYITFFTDGKFYSTGGVSWSYAVPIQLGELTQEEVGL
ncbi:hypothetical protein [Psychrobacter sp. LV10R520-6]|uniref:hypothetical protein n=1 Tax=Psychrobacter sp. LV10R520-6 TaxID=1415574 RepID=UPI0024CDB0CC|nr:hypothetical protein [Psychrobacter sp. LV10R520-6]SNT70151.1 hypothetical protein SAMN04488491_1294 [Psychrobacter sp. LV10R520-6]